VAPELRIAADESLAYARFSQLNARDVRPTRTISMFDRNLTKRQRRVLRELADVAHSRELSAELMQLEADFSRWHSGELDPHELNDRIHAFHQGPSRKLFSRYTDSDKTIAVASAIARGILAESEVEEDILELLRSTLGFFREQQASR